MLLDLRQHCVETTAKQERRRVVSALLELDETNERFALLAEDLDLLTGFLESSDFQRMRSERPELSGGADIRVELTRDAKRGEFVLRVVGTPPEDSR